MIYTRWLYELDYRATRRLVAWGVLCVALLTYLLTLEPTASFWDCPEYVAVATGLQVGHPPGNPLWMLVARFFVNFAPGPEYRALAVNVMSAVCAALTVMLLFLTIEFFARRLVRPHTRQEVILTLGASCTGALAFCWCDSFWFSAVEAEVYAFSSLCTALLFWISLVWFQRRHEPHSDRYLILLAYLTGLTMGVHELNLLCLPALLLVVVFGLRGNLSRWRIALALIAGLAAIAFVLYGLIPGFIGLAKQVELACVNGLGMPFNSGLLITWTGVMALLAGVCVWLNYARIRRRRLLRFLRIALWSVLMVLTGFSCYALIIIRASAGTPLNTGNPSDIFSFSAYFAREQYGKSPLVYGVPFTAKPLRQRTVSGADTAYSHYAITRTGTNYVRGMAGMPVRVAGSLAIPEDSLRNAALQRRGGNWYQVASYNFERMYPPEMYMWFSRMHSHDDADVRGYLNWIGAEMEDMREVENVAVAVDEEGNPVDVPEGKPPYDRRQVRPTYGQNFSYFAVYQLAYMYWRYFAWNFVGRQNDYTGHGEPDAGNFITGIDVLDCLMLDVVREAPANAGEGNRGRNVYFALPMLLGIAGLCYELCSGIRGRRQALLIAVLFILTGMAIVVYLNQGPVQARDRDYAFLGSWYAYCIWIGLGVLGINALMRRCLRQRPVFAATLSLLTALAVPFQMLSQTWDDHDRSGRTIARDMGHNMVQGLEEQAIVFASQGNYIFPLWYTTEVEEERTDLRILSAPYMSLPWYPAQMRTPMRKSRPIAMTVPPALAASDLLGYVRLGKDTTWTPAVEALKTLYTTGIREYGQSSGEAYATLETPKVYFVQQGDTVRIDLTLSGDNEHSALLSYKDLLMLDILASNADSPSPRQVVWTPGQVKDLYGGQLLPYIEKVGLMDILNPANPGLNVRETARMALTSYRYGTAPGVLEGGKEPYFDPVAAGIASDMRKSVILCARELSESGNSGKAMMALALLDRLQRKLPPSMVPYEAVPRKSEAQGINTADRYDDEGLMMSEAYSNVALVLDRPDLKEKADSMYAARKRELAEIARYRDALRPAYRPFVTYRLERLIYVLRPHPGKP